MLGMIKGLYTQKQWLDKLDKELSNFDREYTKVQEYIGDNKSLKNFKKGYISAFEN